MPRLRGHGHHKAQNEKPEYRCNKGHEFEVPLREDASCVKYTARFGNTFLPFTENFGRGFLRQGCPRFSDQLAMQEFDFSRMETVFQSTFPEAATVISRFISLSYLPPEAADIISEVDREEYLPTGIDGRENVLREIRARRGQQAFRDALRMRYGDQSMISGRKVLHVLEAADIRPYRGEADNHPENGLLLRADLHTLFELDLLGIHPSTLSIHLHPYIHQFEYLEFQGRPVSCTGDKQPSLQALKLRWERFQQRAASDRKKD
jgi:putative restriction endonuclease